MDRLCLVEEPLFKKVISTYVISERRNGVRQPHLEVEYCTQRRLLLRAVWIALELLTQ